MFGTIMSVLLYSALAVFALCLVKGALFTAQQQTVRMVTRFGKFQKVAEAGLNFKVPLIDKAEKPLSLRTEQNDVKVTTITKDKVSVTLVIAVQLEVIPEQSRDAFYKRNDAERQIDTFVNNSVLAAVPEMDLDAVFQSKDELASAVQKELADDMNDFGYRIRKTLITNIIPDARVTESMNAINAARRERVAAEERGEGEKIITIKRAEAEAERKRLQGEGIAQERMAIAKGLEESAKLIQDALGSTVNGADVMNILMTTQGYDAMRDMAASSRSNLIFVPNNAPAFTELLSATAGGQIVRDNAES